MAGKRFSLFFSRTSSGRCQENSPKLRLERSALTWPPLGGQSAMIRGRHWPKVFCGSHHRVDEGTVFLGMRVKDIQLFLYGAHFPAQHRKNPLSHLYGYFGLVRLTQLGRGPAWVKA